MSEPGTFLLSVDFEDWHQLVGRGLGLNGWDAPSGAFERQVREVLRVLDELEAKATFFVLGMTAKNYPALVEEVASRGHELACHGYWHRRVFAQSRDEFRRDVEECLAAVEGIAGRRPVAYRAPAFSINRDAVWAYETLADLGVRYDSSLYDSPRIPRRITPVPTTPFRVLGSGRELWELPVAVSKVGRFAVPIGGGAYWRALPEPLLLRALAGRAGEGGYAALYLHPYECDPSPLEVSLPSGTATRGRVLALVKGLQRNPGRRRVVPLLRAVAERFRLVSYEQVYGEIEQRFGTRTKTLSPEGVLV